MGWSSLTTKAAENVVPSCKTSSSIDMSTILMPLPIAYVLIGTAADPADENLTSWPMLFTAPTMIKGEPSLAARILGVFAAVSPAGFILPSFPAEMEKTTPSLSSVLRTSAISSVHDSMPPR